MLSLSGVRLPRLPQRLLLLGLEVVVVAGAVVDEGLIAGVAVGLEPAVKGAASCADGGCDPVAGVAELGEDDRLDLGASPRLVCGLEQGMELIDAVMTDDVHGATSVPQRV